MKENVTRRNFLAAAGAAALPAGLAHGADVAAKGGTI